MTKTKKYWILVLSFSFLWMSISCKQSASDKYKIIRSSKYKETIQESRKEVGMHMFTSDIPGLSVAVILNNKLIWSEGLGYACKELKVPVHPDTKFRIGGVSKLFTGALLARYIEDGELDLNTPIGQYYPELPADKAQLTLYTLAAQMSGLRAPTSKEENSPGFPNIRKGISVFINDSLLFKPGTYNFESDYNYDLIGAVIERKTEKYFYNILKEKLTDTLHLGTTMADNPIAIIDNLSQCYDKNFIARTVRATTQDNRHRTASVGMLSSAVDIANMMNEYLHPTIFKPETVKQILQQAKLKDKMSTNNGLGLFIGRDNHGRELYMSSGTTKGGSAAVIAYPKLDLVVAMVCNLTNEKDDIPVFKVASKFIDLLEPQPEPEKEKQQLKQPEKKEEGKTDK